MSQSKLVPERVQFDRLIPSLQEINFQLTSTVIGEQNLQSLAYSVSIEKISSQIIKDNNQKDSDYNYQFNLQQKLIQVPMIEIKNEKMSKQKQKQTNKQQNQTKKIQSNYLQKVLRNLQQSKAKIINLATTSSTIKNLSPRRGLSPQQYQQMIKNRTKKSITHQSKRQEKPQVGENKKQIKKYAPYLQKNKSKKSQLKSENFSIRMQVRGRLFSTRK